MVIRGLHRGTDLISMAFNGFQWISIHFHWVHFMGHLNSTVNLPRHSAWPPPASARRAPGTFSSANPSFCRSASSACDRPLWGLWAVVSRRQSSSPQEARR